MSGWERYLERSWGRAFASLESMTLGREGRALRVRGDLVGLPVRVLSEYTDHENTIIHHARVIVTLPVAAPGGVRLKPREFWGETHATGDADFDALVHLTGEREVALRLFVADIRTRAVALSRGGWTPELRRKRVSLTWSGPLAELPGVSVRLAELARELVSGIRGLANSPDAAGAVE